MATILGDIKAPSIVAALEALIEEIKNLEGEAYEKGYEDGKENSYWDGYWDAYDDQGFDRTDP